MRIMNALHPCCGPTAIRVEMELAWIRGRFRPSLWVLRRSLWPDQYPAKRSRLWLLLRSTSCVHAMLSILLQQALSLGAAADASANQRRQFIQFAFVRRLYALKIGWAVVAIDVDAIQRQYMKAYKVN